MIFHINFEYAILVKNADDSYTIFLNARLSQESRVKSYYHALRHIQEQEFEKQNVQDIEIQAHLK